VSISTSDPSGIVSSYKATRPTKFIIHGFTKDGSEPWIVSMISNLLSVGDFNIINVRWGPGAAEPYPQAAVNARVVGLEIAYLINTLTVILRLFNARFYELNDSI
jgi:pancreatic triacylglycerol lipase